MEKFYTVNEGSALYEDYWAWKNSIEPNRKIADDFFKEFGIESTLFCPFSTVLVLFLQKMIKLNLQNNFVLKRQMKGCDFLRKTLSLIKNG